MENNITKIQKKINKARKEMDLAIKNKENYNKIYEKSIYVDKLINEYLEVKTNIENERRKLMTKYNDLIEVPLKKEIIKQISIEVQEKFPDVKQKELEQFSTNVYIYATLIVHNIPEQDIVNQLIFLNNKYIDSIKSENEQIIGKEMETPTLEYLKYLKDKYIEIIKERI